MSLSFHGTLSGLIWATFCGWAMASYITSFIFRLPRSEPFLDSPPFCDHCCHPLGPKDLFTLLSWALSRGKCRYCGVAVTPLYFISEALAMLSFILTYVFLGFSEPQLLLALLAAALMVYVAIDAAHHYGEAKVALAAIMIGLMMRVLNDASICPLFFTGVMGTSVALLLRKYRASPQTLLWLVIIAGIWLPMPWFAAFLILSAPVLWRPLAWRNIPASALPAVLIFGEAFLHAIIQALQNS